MFAVRRVFDLRVIHRICIFVVCLKKSPEHKLFFIAPTLLSEREIRWLDQDLPGQAAARGRPSTFGAEQTACDNVSQHCFRVLYPGEGLRL